MDAQRGRTYSCKVRFICSALRLFTASNGRDYSQLNTRHFTVRTILADRCTILADRCTILADRSEQNLKTYRHAEETEDALVAIVLGIPETSSSMRAKLIRSYRHECDMRMPHTLCGKAAFRPS